jgi:hypothetical protein
VPLFGHAVRESPKQHFAITEFLGCFLERTGPEEHLPRQQKRHGEGRNCPPIQLVVQASQQYPKKT